jgi:parallel beta-helix repeat protein
MRHHEPCPVAILLLELLVLLTFLAELPAGADPRGGPQEWYVATNGDDGNAGTKGAPFRTMTKGVSMLAPGDTLWVRGGIYAESFIGNIPGGNSWSERVKVAAYPEEAVTIRPDPGADFVFRFQSEGDSFIVIDGFIIDGANVTYDSVKITYSDSAAHHIRIKNSEIKNAPSNGVLITRSDKLIPKHNQLVNVDVHDNGTKDFGHGMYIASSHTVIRGSSIYRNAGWGVHVYNGDYPALTANNNVVRDNEIFDNARVGDRGPGIILSSGRDNIAFNNVIRGNNGGIQIDYGATRPRAFNNTVFANAYGIYIGNGSRDAEIRNNIVFQNEGGGITNEGISTRRDHNLAGDPRFVDEAALDFHLQASSPAIDTGATIDRVQRDFDDVDRPQCEAYDIGAFESTACSSGLRSTSGLVI